MDFLNILPIVSNTTIEVISLKKIISLVVCTAVILAGFAFLTEYNLQTKNNAIPQNIENRPYSTSNGESSQENVSRPVMTSREDAYVMRTYEGKIGIFKNEDSTPFQVIEVEVASLPETDRLLLENGISFTDVSKLRQAIEDYES